MPQVQQSRRPLQQCAASKPATSFDDEAELEEAPSGNLQPSTSYGLSDNGDDDAESRELAITIARVCWETKGEDVLVLHVAPLVYWTRYKIFATVFSRPQLSAILAKVEKEAEEKFGRRPAAAADGRSEWELLDYGDVVVHVMTAQQRDYYDLEGFYGAAEELELPFMREEEKAGPAWETRM